jgi:copper transport protein
VTGRTALQEGALRRLVRALFLPLLLGTAGMAQAHAVALASDPPDGAVLADPPAEVVVQFNEPVSLVRAQILDGDGQDVLSTGGARSGEDGLHLVLPDGLGQGSYTVSYHVVSLDGHPVAGSVVFSLGRVSRGASAGIAPEETQAWRWSFLAARLGLDLSLLVAAGGMTFAGLVRPKGPSREAALRIAGMAAALGTGLALLTVGLEGGMLLGGSASLLLAPGAWRMGALSAFGCTALCAVAGLSLVGLAARFRRLAGAGLLGMTGACLVLGSFALSGHVVTAGPRWLTSPPLLIHVAAAAFWAGSLLPLGRALSRPTGEAGSLLQRFSALAVWAVGVLILAGLVLAWVQVRQPGALLSTEYGRLLLLKLALVGGLLVLAALNRVRLTPALVRGEAEAPRRLRRSIGTEVALVAVILGITAALGTTPPPRALLAVEQLDGRGPADDHPHAGSEAVPRERHVRLAGPGFQAEVVLGPGEAGANHVMIYLRDPEGRPLEVPELSLRLSNPDRGVAPLDRRAQPAGSGVWHLADLVLAVPGDWILELDILVTDFERRTAKATFHL